MAALNNNVDVEAKENPVLGPLLHEARGRSANRQSRGVTALVPHDFEIDGRATLTIARRPQARSWKLKAAYLFAFSAIAVPTALSYYVTNQNEDKTLPSIVKIPAGLVAALVNVAFSGREVIDIMKASWALIYQFCSMFKLGYAKDHSVREALNAAFQSTNMLWWQIGLLTAVWFPVVALSFGVSMTYFASVSVGKNALGLGDWMDQMAQGQVLYSAIMQIPPLMSAARWATNCCAFSAENRAISSHIGTLESYLKRAKAEDNPKMLDVILTESRALISGENQKTLREKLIGFNHSTLERAFEGKGYGIKIFSKAGVIGTLVIGVSGLALWIATTPSIMASVAAADTLPMPLALFGQLFKGMDIDQFLPGLVMNIPNLAFSLWYSVPGWNLFPQMYRRTQRNLDGSLSRGVTAYALTTLILFLSAGTSVAQAFNGNSDLPGILSAKLLVSFLNAATAVCALLTNSGGAFVPIYEAIRDFRPSSLFKCCKAEETLVIPEALSERDKFEAKVVFVEAAIAFFKVASLNKEESNKLAILTSRNTVDAERNTAAAPLLGDELHQSVLSVYFKEQMKLFKVAEAQARAQGAIDADPAEVPVPPPGGDDVEQPVV